MSAERLSGTLAEQGVAVGVEARGKLAIVTIDDPLALVAVRRRDIVAAARASGFTNVCLEITAMDAALPGA